MNYLLDTNFVIGLLRGVGPYFDRLDRLVDEVVPAVSVVTRSEVFAGCHPHEEKLPSIFLIVLKLLRPMRQLRISPEDTSINFGEKGSHCTWKMR